MDTVIASNLTGNGIFLAIQETLNVLWNWIIAEADTLLSSEAFLYLFVFGVAVSEHKPHLYRGAPRICAGRFSFFIFRCSSLLSNILMNGSLDVL